MDSDDDYQALSPPEILPEVQFRRLKRLKKSGSNPSPGLVDGTVLSTRDGKMEALESDSRYPGFGELNATVESTSSQESLSDAIFMEDDDRMRCGSDEEGDENTNKVLEIDGDVTGGVVGQDGIELELEKNENHATGEEALFSGNKGKKKKREKKGKSDIVGELNTDLPVSGKWREKERKSYLKELHTESQRLLRESRDASFKPTPVVHKPISTILEKLRKRKLEVTKKFYGDGGNCKPAKLVGFDVSSIEKERENVTAIVDKEIVTCVDQKSGLAGSSSREHSDTAKHLSNEYDQNEMCEEDPTSTFRAPVPDTQDLFDDSEPNCSALELNEEEAVVLSREDFAPSLLTMDLKLDSALNDDSSSEEECNDKENIDHHPAGVTDEDTSQACDPVKGFIDEEAEEEDDSDNDAGFSQANEEDQDGENPEEFNDIIATDFKEKPVDNERRNELHQKWLEQQDAAGTDNLMQRLRYGRIRGDTFMEEEDPETDEDEEFVGETQEEYLQHKPARMNTTKVKELILQLMPDKEDVYLSEDDDDTQTRNAKHLFFRKEEKSELVSPADDESSREVFGLIKKLNIVPINKRKPKELSFFDTMLQGRNINNSSKSSFLGRVSNHPISSKQGSGKARSFIFGRDDSNSRSSMPAAEDSSDTVTTLEARPTRHHTAKYSSSQTKSSSDAADAVAESASGASLLEILKQSSLQSNSCNKDGTLDLTESIFSFRVSKKPMKVEQMR